MTKPTNTPLAVWLREKRRRNAPGIRQVYTGKNVISLSGWHYAKAVQEVEIARDRLRLARANLAAAEEASIDLLRDEIDLIVAAVLEALGEKKLAAKRRKRSREAQPKTKKN
ncbi:MAG: hypothetical protein AB7O71_10770 [Hyphomicrobiaceae bacterium]